MTLPSIYFCGVSDFDLGLHTYPSRDLGLIVFGWGSISKVLLLILFLIGLSGGQYELAKSTRVLSVSFRVVKIVWLYRLI